MSHISRSSRAQENSVANDFTAFGGKRTSGSGAKNQDGDVEFFASLRDAWLVECKETHANILRLYLADWDKAVQEANTYLRRALMNIRAPKVSLYVCELGDFEEMLSKAGRSASGLKIHRRKVNQKSFSFTSRDWMEFANKHREPGLEPIISLLFFGKTDLVLVDRQFFLGVINEAYGKTDTTT